MNRLVLIYLMLKLVILSESAIAQQYKFKNRQGKSVSCRIRLVKVDNSEVNLATDENGFIDLTGHCSNGSIVQFNPINPRYTGKTIPCKGGDVEVEVLRKEEWANLKINSRLDPERSKRYVALAALSNNQLTELSRSFGDQKETDSLEVLTYSLLASYFDLDPNDAVYSDPLQKNKIVAKEILIDSIQAFQKLNGLPSDGVIGWQTMSKMAETLPSVLYSNTEWRVNQ